MGFKYLFCRLKIIVSGDVYLFYQKNLTDNGWTRLTSSEPKTIVVKVLFSHTCINMDLLNRVCELSSKNLLPRLEYRLMLEAYKATANEDWRKAIQVIETVRELLQIFSPVIYED